MIEAELHVLLGDVTVGTLAHLSGDRTTFIFDSAYTRLSNRPTLSVSFFWTRTAKSWNANALPPDSRRPTSPTYFWKASSAPFWLALPGLASPGIIRCCA